MGAPVPDIQNQPVAVPLAGDGSFTFTTEFGNYELAVTQPEGFATPPPIRFTANGATVALPTLSLAAALPSTGTDARPLFLAGGGLLALGLLLSAGAVPLRLRRTRAR
ncbi:MAG: hypothetical protein M3N46_13150 [Actinomycetota bacterium]|nr:hypothetical protein [Actinomycetota bacterium]